MAGRHTPQWQAYTIDVGTHYSRGHTAESNASGIYFPTILPIITQAFVL
jgi:hypothetical protein